MSDSKDERVKKIVDFIHKNKENFQVNISRIDPVEKGKKTSNSLRAVAVANYQTKEKLVYPFYKQISRCIE